MVLGRLDGLQDVNLPSWYYKSPVKMYRGQAYFQYNMSLGFLLVPESALVTSWVLLQKTTLTSK